MAALAPSPPSERAHCGIYARDEVERQLRQQACELSLRRLTCQNSLRRLYSLPANEPASPTSPSSQTSPSSPTDLDGIARWLVDHMERSV